MDKQNDERICVHLMPKEKFSKGFIAFTNDAFPDMNVWFVLYGPERTGYLTSTDCNVVLVERPEDVLLNSVSKKLLHDSNLIILNWVNWRLAAKLFPYHAKMLYLFWGGDLYGAVALEPYSPSRLYKAFLLRHAKGLITLIPGDLDQAERLSKKHGAWHLGLIWDTTKDEAEKNDKCTFNKPIGKTRILVGNSATPSNRHEAVFEMLEPFKNKGIEVLVPLSYGEDEYRGEVMRAGKQLLGDSFVPLLDFMDVDEYEALLSTVTVGVFNHDRQQGMGNIGILMRSGGKIFISQQSPMWHDFAHEGRVVFPTEEIPNLTYEEFIAYSDDSAAKNYEFARLQTRYIEAVSRWSSIYSDYDVRSDS